MFHAVNYQYVYLDDTDLHRIAVTISDTTPTHSYGTTSVMDTQLPVNIGIDR